MHHSHEKVHNNTAPGVVQHTGSLVTAGRSTICPPLTDRLMADSGGALPQNMVSISTVCRLGSARGHQPTDTSASPQNSGCSRRAVRRYTSKYIASVFPNRRWRQYVTETDEMVRYCRQCSGAHAAARIGPDTN